MCLPPTLLFVFIQIDKTDLTWVGIRSFGGGCVTGRRHLCRRRSVSLWWWCVCPLVWAVRAAAQPVATLAQQPGYLCEAVQAQPTVVPSSYLLKLLLSCPRVSIPIHLLNKRWDSCVMRSFFSLCLFPGRRSFPESVRQCVRHRPRPFEGPSHWQQVKWGRGGPSGQCPNFLHPAEYSVCHVI